jgi:hypothetical protein
MNSSVRELDHAQWAIARVVQVMQKLNVPAEMKVYTELTALLCKAASLAVNRIDLAEAGIDDFPGFLGY